MFSTGIRSGNRDIAETYFWSSFSTISRFLDQTIKEHERRKQILVLSYKLTLNVSLESVLEIEKIVFN